MKEKVNSEYAKLEQSIGEDFIKWRSLKKERDMLEMKMKEQLEGGPSQNESNDKLLNKHDNSNVHNNHTTPLPPSASAENGQGEMDIEPAKPDNGVVLPDGVPPSVLDIHAFATCTAQLLVPWYDIFCCFFVIVCCIEGGGGVGLVLRACVFGFPPNHTSHKMTPVQPFVHMRRMQGRAAGDVPVYGRRSYQNQEMYSIPRTAFRCGVRFSSYPSG